MSDKKNPEISTLWINRIPKLHTSKFNFSWKLFSKMLCQSFFTICLSVPMLLICKPWNTCKTQNISSWVAYLFVDYWLFSTSFSFSASVIFFLFVEFPFLKLCFWDKCSLWLSLGNDLKNKTKNSLKILKHEGWWGLGLAKICKKYYSFFVKSSLCSDFTWNQNF